MNAALVYINKVQFKAISCIAYKCTFRLFVFLSDLVNDSFFKFFKSAILIWNIHMSIIAEWKQMYGCICRSPTCWRNLIIRASCKVANGDKLFIIMLNDNILAFDKTRDFSYATLVTHFKPHDRPLGQNRN